MITKSRNEREGKYAGRRNGMHYRASWRKTQQGLAPLGRIFVGFWVNITAATVPLN